MHTDNNKYNFRCDSVMKGCSWQASANSKEELLSKIEQHGKQEHHITNIDPETKRRVEGAISRQAA